MTIHVLPTLVPTFFAAALALGIGLRPPIQPAQCILEWKVPGGGGLAFRCNSTCTAGCTITQDFAGVRCADPCYFVCSGEYVSGQGPRCSQMDACPAEDWQDCIPTSPGMLFGPICDCVLP